MSSYAIQLEQLVKDLRLGKLKDAKEMSPSPSLYIALGCSNRELLFINNCTFVHTRASYIPIVHVDPERSVKYRQVPRLEISVLFAIYY